MNRVRMVCILASLLAACSWLACRKANNPPHILSMTATPSQVRPNDSSVVAATVYDEDGDSLAYQWSVSGGFLAAGGGAQVTWKAPSSPASCTVQLIVTDPPGASDTSSVTVLVVANQPPVIASVSAAPARVKPYEACSLKVVASDPEGGPLTYLWRVSAGFMFDTTSASTEWYTPEYSGTYYAKVTVTDSEQLTVSDSVAVTVEKDTTTLIDQSYHVNALSYRSEKVYLSEGYDVSGYFSVQANDINFYVFDEVNYTKWVNNQSSQGEVVINRSSYASYSFWVSASGYYYFVLDNTFSILYGKDVYVYAQEVSP